MKPFAEQFYKSKQWKQTQKAYMESKNYICERCGAVAGICHHRKHLSPKNINNPYITLDWNNLEALCYKCHAEEHNGSSACVNGVSFDSEGNLIYKPIFPVSKK